MSCTNSDAGGQQQPVTLASYQPCCIQLLVVAHVASSPRHQVLPTLHTVNCCATAVLRSSNPWGLARVTSNQWKQCRSRFSQSATIDIFLRVCGAKPWKSKKVELRPGPIFVYCIDLYVVVVSLGFVGAVHQGPIAFSQLLE